MPLPYRPRTAVLCMLLSAMAGTIAGCNAAIDSGKAPTTPVAPVSIPAVPAALDGPKLAARDVKITSCKLADFGQVNVSLTVINHATTAASYTVSGELVDGKGVRQGEFAALTVSPLLPGRTAKLTANGWIDRDQANTVKCHLTSAQRF